MESGVRSSRITCQRRRLLVFIEYEKRTGVVGRLLDLTRKHVLALLVFCNDCIHGMFLFGVKYYVFKLICFNEWVHLSVYELCILKCVYFVYPKFWKLCTWVILFLFPNESRSSVSLSLSLFRCKLVSYLRAVKRQIFCPLVVFCSDCVRCNFLLQRIISKQNILLRTDQFCLSAVILPFVSIVYT